MNNPHVSSQKAIKTLREWDHLGTTNKLYYRQAIDSLEKQLEALEQSYAGCKHNVKAITGEADGLREQLEAKQKALEKIAHGELTFDNMREIARAECSHSNPGDRK